MARGGRFERYEPTPQEIRQRCLQIQSTWSDSERMSRLRVDMRPSYRRCDGVPETIGAADYSGHHDARARLQESDR